ncbi:PolC-type DNA polymerase III N-terminal domain-containing protein, partial [Brotaphodocola sp.]|uniref:PolC-type DNA polymerase III N-terminal domain-containing protein n=1 Tax=Brotaphodocola sp. TaxID=3073577 RepID=UPI003D7D6626
MRRTMKEFLEVFPGLHMTDQMKELMGMVKVDRVSMTRDRRLIRVYIESPRLIHRKNIMDLERGIAEQLFYGKQIQIKIFEKYRLSEQYTPEKLLAAYRDSLLLELKHYSIVEYSIFRKAQFTFPEPDLLHMTVEDTMINREKAGELKRILEKVFYERCSIPVEIEFEYIPATRAKASIERELLAEQEAMRMTAAVADVLNLRARAEGGGQDGIEGQSAAVSAGGAGSREIGAQKSAGAGANGTTGKAAAVAGASAGGNSAKSAAVSSDSHKEAASGGAGSHPGVLRGGKRENFKKSDWSSGGYRKKSDNPDVLYGRDFEDDFIEIEKIEGEIGEVTIRGKILKKDSRELKNGKTIVMFQITDFTDTITVKIFADQDALEDVNKATAEKSFIRLRGMTTIDRFDGELTIGSVRGIKKGEDFTSKRMDHSPLKRVELHCHTKMSDMDGVSDVKDIVKRAKSWGMPAIAVTDHGCVQAFTEANHALDKGDEFKILYGVEGYLV